MSYLLATVYNTVKQASGINCIGTWLPILRGILDTTSHQLVMCCGGPYTTEVQNPPQKLTAGIYDPGRLGPILLTLFHQANCLGTARRSEHCALAFCLELQKEQPQTSTGEPTPSRNQARMPQKRTSVT